MSAAEEWAGRQTPELIQPLRSLYLSRLMDKTQRAIHGISGGKGEPRNRERLSRLHQLYDELMKMKKEWDQWHQ